ncbi:MAG: MarP family serine protease [Candidatus Saccharimonadales bacterium]
MSSLDIFIIILALLQAAWWARAGFMHSLFSLSGFWLGFVIGTLLAPVLMTLVAGAWVQMALAIVVILTVASLGGSLGQLMGRRLGQLTHRLRLGWLDTSLGALLGVVITLATIWLGASLLSGSPFTGLNRQLQQSTIIHQLNRALPPTPAILTRIGGLINQQIFPRIFIGPAPRPVEPVNQSTSAEVEAVLATAGASTVRIEGLGCGGIITGSGFVAQENLVVTNAHVVAGITSPTIIDANGSRSGEIVYFDPDQDIAMVRTLSLAGLPLPLASQLEPRSTTAVVLGYPGGGRLKGTPAGILRQIEARGLDIYGRRAVTRSMYELQAEVISGNSGGPVVLPNGTVVGLVVARSESVAEVSYSLTSKVISAALESVTATSQLVTSGRCLPR